MKRLLIIGLAFTVCDALYAEEDMPGLSLREAEKCFLEHNVQLTAQRYNVDRAQAQVVQARLFDNPVISLEQNVYNRLNGKYFDVGKEGEAAIEIEQEIPIARQRNKRIKLEEINREAAGYRFEEVLRTLRSELYRSFVDTYYQSRSIRVYDRAGNFINDYFAIGVTCSVPIFNRNQGEIKSAKLELLQQGKEEEYAVDKAEMELYSACHQLQKAVELYRAFDSRVEQDFEQLMEGVNENFYERNINMLEFIDYYQSYKEACLQCYALRRDVFGAMENLNTVVGRTIFKF